MCKMHGMTLGTILVLIVAGCGKPAATGPSAATPQGSESANNSANAVADDDGPAAAVSKFLEAVRTGNDDVARQMLSTVAQKKTAALNRSVTPPASDTAKITVGKVDYVDGGARVAATWTDMDLDGQEKTDRQFWIVRRESSGWRIAGMAWLVFPGEKPVFLNFEEPEEMARQLQWIRGEMLRRMEKEESGLQAQGAEKQEKPIRR